MASEPLVHPDRPQTNFKPVKAFRHFRQLIADKEDTEQVFHIIEAMRGKDFTRRARDFIKSEGGQRILAEERDLPAILDDHDRLRQMPKGSLADHYVRFMEAEGLTAAGLVAEYEKFAGGDKRYGDLLEVYGNRLRDTHDLSHVLTGYGRDALGEECLLAFSYSQNGNIGVIGIAYAGTFELRKHLPPGTRNFAAVREGQRNGKAALDIAAQPMVPLLEKPIEDVRAELGIREPVIYRECLAHIEAHQLDPRELLKPEAA
jgi:ubiquinone biosynthesis protein COQ4